MDESFEEKLEREKRICEGLTLFVRFTLIT